MSAELVPPEVEEGAAATAASSPPRLAPVAQPPVPPATGPAARLLRLATALGWALVGFAVVLAIWAFGASRVEHLPTPGDTFTVLRDTLSDPFYDNGPDDQGVGLLVWDSLQRVFKGFGLAMLVGMPLGLLMGASRRVWQAANPVVQLLRPVSPLAWFPIWLVVFKDSNQAAVWVIFMTTLWPTVLNTAAGAAAVPADQRDVARVFHLRRWAYVRHVLVPHTLPSAVTGMRLSMGVGWMVIVAVEMLGGNSGIGRYVWTSYNGGNMALVVQAILVIGVLGLVLDLLLLRLAKAVALEEVAP